MFYFTSEISSYYINVPISLILLYYISFYIDSILTFHYYSLCYDESVILKGWNSATITLLSKEGKGPKYVRGYKPVALINIG